MASDKEENSLLWLLGCPDYWAYTCLTIELLDYWAVELLGCRTIGWFPCPAIFPGRSQKTMHQHVIMIWLLIYHLRDTHSSPHHMVITAGTVVGVRHRSPSTGRLITSRIWSSNWATVTHGCTSTWCNCIYEYIYIIYHNIMWCKQRNVLYNIYWT